MAVKTYLSDRFNNWLNTEWIDGTTGGINSITAVDVSEGKLTMDALILQKKIFNIFAESRLSSQNFWVQVAFDVTARRVMSAKQIPNL